MSNHINGDGDGDDDDSSSNHLPEEIGKEHPPQKIYWKYVAHPEAQMRMDTCGGWWWSIPSHQTHQNIIISFLFIKQTKKKKRDAQK